MNIHQSISREFGKKCLNEVRHLEKLGLKIARFKNHLRFSLHCKHHNIIPTSLRLTKNTIIGPKASRLLKRTERSLLNIRIGQIVNKLKWLKTDYEQTWNSVLGESCLLPEPMKSQIQSSILKSQEKEHLKYKERQQKKFARLSKRYQQHSNVQNTTIDYNPTREHWVKNLSKRQLTEPESKVLLKGLNFAIAPTELPVVDFITATEKACLNLSSEGQRQSFRSKVTNLLSRPRKLHTNLSKSERQALVSLRKDPNIKILPADKGRCVVVLDRDDYKKKCSALLSDKKTYESIGKRNPTSSYKSQLVQILSKIEDEKGINRIGYRQLYPTTETPPRFYGLPKIHKPDVPLRPIVSSIGSITYNSAKHIARILSPLVGLTDHHIKNSQQFVTKIKDRRVESDEELRSYDVTALFTSVPIGKALDVIQDKLEQDNTLHSRTKMSPTHVINLLRFCLETTYFVYDGIFYKQIHGAAMGSPVSPIVCNLYMEDFEKRAISSAINPPLWWFRYVDDTYTKLKKDHAEEFSQYINMIDPDIQFTVEREVDHSLAFLDTLTMIQDDGSLKVKIYRKPTHTDQYLNFDSNHPLEHKMSVLRTLYNRAESIVTDDDEVLDEKKHIKEALHNCDYPEWLFKKLELQKKSSKQASKRKVNESKCSITISHFEIEEGTGTDCRNINLIKQ